MQIIIKNLSYEDHEILKNTENSISTNYADEQGIQSYALEIVDDSLERSLSLVRLLLKHDIDSIDMDLVHSLIRGLLQLENKMIEVEVKREEV